MVGGFVYFYVDSFKRRDKDVAAQMPRAQRIMPPLPSENNRPVYLRNVVPKNEEAGGKELDAEI